MEICRQSCCQWRCPSPGNDIKPLLLPKLCCSFPFSPILSSELHPVYTIFPAILLAVFKKAVGMETEASADLKGFLQVKYEDIEVKFLSDTSLKVKLGWIKRARLNSDDALAVLEDEAELDVSNSLERVKKDGYLPNDETWTVDYAATY